jgi:hypothetical protein
MSLKKTGTPNAAIEADVEELADVQLCATVVKPKRPRAGSQPLPDHLPRIEHRHEPDSCACGQCGKDLEPGPRIIVFDYQPEHSGKHVRQFLDSSQGHLMIDDYGGYKALFARQQKRRLY